MLLLLSCAPPPLAAVDPTPSVHISWPEPEAEVEACTLVIVEFENFQIRPYDPEIGDPPNSPGEGHWHVYFDETYIGSYTPYVLLDLSTLLPTDYLLTVELEENQHQPVLDADGNPIQDTVPIHLLAGTCNASLTGLPS